MFDLRLESSWAKYHTNISNDWTLHSISLLRRADIPVEGTAKLPNKSSRCFTISFCKTLFTKNVSRFPVLVSFIFSTCKKVYCAFVEAEVKIVHGIDSCLK